MLTAVENHFGPGRPYSTLHYGAVTNLLPPCPMTPLPTLNSATPMAMSPAEFARPHPKTASRMNGIQSLRACNGISSPRSKYSSIDQSGPVNLAMAAHHPISSPDARRKSPQSAFNDPVTSNSEPSHSDQDAIHRSIASLYGTPFCPTPVSAGVNSQSVAAYQMNFSNMYGRAGVYPSSALYPPPHSLTSSMHHNRPTYIPSHVDPYSPYLPPPHAPTVIPPQTSIVIAPTQVTTVITQKSSMISHKLDVAHDTMAIGPPNDHQTSTINKESKLSNQISTNVKSSGFKVPSGKEGSLKHRILTRPYCEKEGASKSKSTASSVTNSVRTSPTSNVKSSCNNNINNNNSKSSNSSSNNNNNNNSNNNNNNGCSHIVTNFSKGSLIEVANGELKRIEDMRAEDFVTASNTNPNLQLADSTVVKFTHVPAKRVMITFVYNNNKLDIESVDGHPYFVYGKGWASFNPETSMALFRLKCQLLEVGDVCLLLRPRCNGPKTSPRPFAQQPKNQYYAEPELHTNVDSRFPPPQNLSRKNQSAPVTAPNTSVNGHSITSYDFNQQHQHQQQQQHQQQNYSQYRMERNNETSVQFHHNLSMETSSSSQNLSGLENDGQTLASDENGVIDATINRKRRWSAPDNICNVDGCQTDSKKCTLH